jgi:tellurite methyltransferase
MNDSISFFDKQFQRQIEQHDFSLNSFEIKALSHIKGRVFDVGCGLGNLSIAAARKGNPVVAIDASAAAIASLNQRARSQNLPLAAYESDAQSFAWEGCFDTVVSIGLLMFLPCDAAHGMVQRLRQATCPHGTMIVNILVKGTTYHEMFGNDEHCLFDPDEVRAWFADWKIMDFSLDEFEAPGHTIKRFATVVAQRLH